MYKVRVSRRPKRRGWKKDGSNKVQKRQPFGRLIGVKMNDDDTLTLTHSTRGVRRVYPHSFLWKQLLSRV